MAHVLDRLVSATPREFGGAGASNRLAYQRDWTFCLLMKLHVEANDYLVVCDYHDDVLMLDSPTAPTGVHFYQIKTGRTKRWTIPALLRQEAGKAGALPSALGKLFRHSFDFQGDIRTLTFVANLPFKVDLTKAPPSDSRIEFTVLDLAPAEVARVKAQLRAELALGADPVLTSSLVFQVSPLSVDGHVDGTKGRLVDFLNNRDPARSYPIQALYRTIADEIERRTNVEGAFTAVVDLVSQKGITRDQFERVVTDCVSASDRHDPQRVLEELRAALIAEQVPFGTRRSVTRALERFILERQDPHREDLARFSEQAGDFCAVALEAHRSGLWDFMVAGHDRLMGHTPPPAVGRDYLLAVIAWEVLTYAEPLPTTDAQP